jgi:hypothetical protein
MIALRLLFIILALVCLGLAFFGVPAGRLNLIAGAAFCLVVALLVV